jgi:predicted RNase H-like HicB family nuclease
MTTVTVEIHSEDGVLWGQVVELPGVFATGEDLDELAEALGEAITLYQSKTESAPAKPKPPAPRRRYRVDRMTLVDA